MIRLTESSLEEAQAFGLECTLDSGVKWYMGIYGSFSQAVDSM
jgi:hypothetical protein